MKKELITILALSMFLFGGCKKGNLLEGFDLKLDLNNNQKLETISETITNKKHTFFYLNESKDTNYIARSINAPLLTGFYDFKGDRCPDFWYTKTGEYCDITMILDNEKGIFSKEERELGQ